MKHLRNIRRNLIKASKQGHASIGLRIQKKIQKKRVLCHQANAVWWLLMVLGNPAPTEMVSVLAETLRTCSSPTPLTTCTVRLPPPVQPSFLTLTSILVRVKLDKKKSARMSHSHFYSVITSSIMGKCSIWLMKISLLVIYLSWQELTSDS